MKKWFSFILALTLIFVLAACNQTAEDVSSDDNEIDSEQTQNEVEEQNTEDEELTLEEVYSKSIEASTSLKSFSMNSDVQMNMSSNQEDQPMNIAMKMSGDMVLEPLTMYQNISTTTEGAEGNVDMEMYVTPEAFYIYESTSDKWMKMPGEFSEQLLGQMANQQQDPGEQLKKMQKFVKDFEFQKDDSSYILKLKADGEKFKDVAQELMANSMPQELQGIGDMFENTTFQNLEYEIHIDKETFYPSKINMNIVMDMQQGEQTITTDMKMAGDYSSFNDVKVEVPQEVIDNAEEISAEDTGS